MNWIILKETPFVLIIHDQTNNLLIAKWSGYLRLTEVKEGCGFMTKFFADNQITIHLSDHRKLRVLSTDVQSYLINEWFPEIKELGVRKVGAVVSDDVFAEISVEKVNHNATTDNLIIEMFRSHEECMNWLTCSE